MDASRHEPSHAGLRSFVWIVLVATLSVALSRAFACATPFAAIATATALNQSRGDAVLAVLVAWAGNQAVGFLLLHYPHGWDTLAWGGAIGLAGVAAAFAASGAATLAERSVVRAVVAFLAAFVAYEGVLLAASCVLPGAGNPFAPWIVALILKIDTIGFTGLLVLHRLALAVGLLPPAAEPLRATAEA